MMPEVNCIVIRQESRPCQVLNLCNDKWVGAIFHLWAQEGHCNQIAYPVAVVEYENGSIQSVPVEQVRFTDSEEYHFNKSSPVEKEKQDVT